jgi:TonB-linked SusC/RagA family outer membrane protein
MQFSFAQEKTVTGVVSDKTGPLPGANVVVKGTKTSTQTDFDGKFTIKAKQGDVLVVSFVGMPETPITVGASNTVNIKMKEGIDLETLVIQTNLGYFKKDANKITSAISTVSGEEFVKQAPSLAFTNALQGKAAGVQVTQRNGMPGQGAYVTVRGTVSITGGYAGASYVVDGAFVSESEASAIAPGDIETLSVLKDATSAAIYGSRGGNGVVVITTKKGKANSKAKFEISNSIGFTERAPDSNLKLMSTAQKLKYEQDLGEGPGFDATPAQLAVLQSFDHSWEKTLLRQGALQNFSFSVSGGTEKMSNYFSLGYNKNEGILKGIDGYNRITAALSNSYQATDWFKFGIDLRGSYETNTLPRDRYNSQNPFAAMVWYNGYEPEFDSDPDTGQLILDADGNPTYNLTHTGFPIGEALRNNPEEERFFRAYARPNIEIKFTKNLTFNTQYSLNYERKQREYFVKPGSVLDGYVGDPNNPGSKTDNGWDNLDSQWTNSLNYKFKLGENHNFNATALYDWTYTNFRGYTLSRKGFIGDLPTSGTALTTVPSTSHLQNSAFGVLGNLDYDYAGKYLASFNIRKDWSSLLGPENNSIIAKGGSIGWVLSKESFFKFKPITFLKFRASLGQLNSTSGLVRYAAISNYSSTGYSTAASTVYNSDRIGNPSITFEQAEKLDIGLETRLFKDRIALSGSYFKDKRNNFLFADISTEGADWNITRNAGDWEAKGFEVELKAFAIKKEDMNLSFYVNGAQFDRTINKLNAPTTEAIRTFTINRVGYSPDTFYLVRYAGVDPTNGDALYYDKDGAITNVYNSEDRVLLKNKTQYAKYEGGFGMEFDFKGFDVATDFVFKSGNYTYNLKYRDLLTDGVSIADNQSTDALDFWTPTNTGASQPAPIQLSGVDNNQDSTRFLQDASYIRFRNLNFGYTFDKKLLKALPLDKVRIYAQLQNLHTWTKFKGDPEVGIGNGESGTAIPGQYAGYSYPTVKSVLFGLTINF